MYGREEVEVLLTGREKAMDWEGNVGFNVDGELLGDGQKVVDRLEKR